MKCSGNVCLDLKDIWCYILNYFFHSTFRLCPDQIYKDSFIHVIDHKRLLYFNLKADKRNFFIFMFVSQSHSSSLEDVPQVWQSSKHVDRLHINPICSETWQTTLMFDLNNLIPTQQSDMFLLEKCWWISIKDFCSDLMPSVFWLQEST